MSAVDTRQTVTIRHEYVVADPACWTDIQQAMAFAARDRTEKGLSNDWDDIIKVTHNDDSIIVYWEEVKP